MATRKRKSLSRRQFIKTAGSAALAAGASLMTPHWASAAQKTLKILQWSHFVPEYDKWFNNTYIKEWGEKNDTKVLVDNVEMTSLGSRAAAEVRRRDHARRNHAPAFGDEGQAVSGQPDARAPVEIL